MVVCWFRYVLLWLENETRPTLSGPACRSGVNHKLKKGEMVRHEEIFGAIKIHHLWEWLSKDLERILERIQPISEIYGVIWRSSISMPSHEIFLRLGIHLGLWFHLTIFLLGHHRNAIIIHPHLWLSTPVSPRRKYILFQLKKKKKKVLIKYTLRSMGLDQVMQIPLRWVFSEPLWSWSASRISRMGPQYTLS